MNITSSQLTNVTEIANVSAAATNGIGLLTAIVSSVISVLGINDTWHKYKVEKAYTQAVNSVTERAIKLGADGIMNFRVEMNGLTVLVYGTAYASAPNNESDALPEL